MSATRRTKIEIIRDILRAIQLKGGIIKPTHLMYKANLSHQKMMLYVDELMENGMMGEELEGKKQNKMYVITDKGNEYLNQYKQIEAFSESFGLS